MVMLEKVRQQVLMATTRELAETGNAVAISEALHLSRNMVSQYLNQLWNEGKLVKINTRPVLFYDVQTLEKLFSIHLKEKEFTSKKEFVKALQPQEAKDFEKLIGAQESLANVVNQCKATISYPPNGLPLLLYGPTGTGKSFMAQLMYEYALNHQLIEADKKFLIVNCSEYANNPELLTANLFGHKKGAFTGADKDNPGLIKLAEGGVLFLDEVHCLPPECQEKLFLFMDKGIYHMVGDNEKWYQSSLRLIFATTEKPEEVLLKTLLRRIPMIITIPSLEERGTHERLQLIHSIFAAEETRIHKSIYLSTLVYQTLLSTTFNANIGELKNAIQASCVNALFHADPNKDRLEIRAYNLPETLKEPKMNVPSMTEQKLISVHELAKFVSHERAILKCNEELLKAYDARENSDLFLKTACQSIDEYQETIVFQKKKTIRKNEYLQGIVSNIFNMLSSRYGFKFVNNDVIAIASYIDDYSRNLLEMNNWLEQEKKHVKQLLSYIKSEWHREYAIAQEIVENLTVNLDMEFDAMFTSVLALNLKKLNRITDLNKRIGIIIAHGFSTASSMADAANKLLGRYVFDAMDMPLQLSSTQIIEQLNRYLAKIPQYEELFLLVDMGSLEEIYKGLEVSNASIGIMNNVTTRLALEIGQGIISNTPMKEIFETAVDYSSANYHIVEHKNREKVILCSCASGMGTAEKLKKILVDSLPCDLPIHVYTYDYNTLLEKQLHDAFFENYEVICIVGTLNPNIPDIRFIPIEDLIINDTLDELHDYFKDYISDSEMKTFQQNILKNFSLSNIMNNLTILNPSKLLEHVADAIDKLQNDLQVRLTNNTCVGLYVHVCCLIERLVTRKSIETYTNVEDFAEKEIAFIKSVKKAFSVVENYYSVEIPVEEIGYIFDYVKNN